MIARFLHSSIVAAADLQRVVVERLRVSQRKSITVVLHIPGETVDCQVGFQAPLSQVGTELLGWFTSQLGPA
uniref:hypothetical protein n=1 Tax=Streptomyces chartreusis TaxID=1969 RepID=UPI003F4946C1